MFASYVQAVVAGNATALRVCTLVLFIKLSVSDNLTAESLLVMHGDISCMLHQAMNCHDCDTYQLEIIAHN